MGAPGAARSSRTLVAIAPSTTGPCRQSRPPRASDHRARTGARRRGSTRIRPRFGSAPHPITNPRCRCGYRTPWPHARLGASCRCNVLVRSRADRRLDPLLRTGTLAPTSGDPQRDRRPDACLIGYTWLGASAQRTACNTEAKLLMLSHAFEAWRVHRVAFRIDARNDRSRSAVERLGAKFEGVRRAERIGADGAVRDSAFYSILAAEWPAVKKGLISRLGRSRAEPVGTDPPSDPSRMTPAVNRRLTRARLRADPHPRREVRPNDADDRIVAVRAGQQRRSG